MSLREVELLYSFVGCTTNTMTTAPLRKPRVFVDVDALFAGAAGPTEHGASLMVLRMAEITLIDAVTSQQVIVEAERNLGDKLPAALSAFQVFVPHLSPGFPMSPGLRASPSLLSRLS
jgi:hypothetical protein